ncbi:spidroin-2-like [Parus major]|uniref:spidroin-2-like n=1 Tax=Parus major TaxID=9157 RepID=UPI0007712295|nr:spidroin-2-like [Parus major]
MERAVEEGCGCGNPDTRDNAQSTFSQGEGRSIKEQEHEEVKKRSPHAKWQQPGCNGVKLCRPLLKGRASSGASFHRILSAQRRGPEAGAAQGPSIAQPEESRRGSPGSVSSRPGSGLSPGQQRTVEPREERPQRHRRGTAAAGAALLLLLAPLCFCCCFWHRSASAAASATAVGWPSSGTCSLPGAGSSRQSSLTHSASLLTPDTEKGLCAHGSSSHAAGNRADVPGADGRGERQAAAAAQGPAGAGKPAEDEGTRGSAAAAPAALGEGNSSAGSSGSPAGGSGPSGRAAAGGAAAEHGSLAGLGRACAARAGPAAPAGSRSSAPGTRTRWPGAPGHSLQGNGPPERAPAAAAQGHGHLHGQSPAGAAGSCGHTAPTARPR